MNRNISFFGYFLRAINWIIIIFQLLAYLSQYISPASFWQLAFLGMGFPIIVCINLGFCIYWLILKKRFFIYPFIVLLTAIPIANRFFKTKNNVTTLTINKPIKIFTYNVHSFFKKLDKFESKDIRDSIFNFAQKENADVYCFQEFYSDEPRDKQNNIDAIMKKLKTPYYYALPYTTRSYFLNNVIFSKYPIVNTGKLIANPYNPKVNVIYVDIMIGKQKIRIYSAHLKSFNISDDIGAFSQENGREKKEDITSNHNKFINKFKIAYIYRSNQVEVIKKHLLDSCKTPVIFAGDFNDTPLSYTYKQLTSILKDSYTENGSGFGTTYISNYPSFRIDYILHSKQIKNYKYTTYNINYSDHKPISASFSLDDINL